MVHLAQCVCFIKTGNSEKKGDAVFWITAQELLLSPSSARLPVLWRCRPALPASRTRCSPKGGPCATFHCPSRLPRARSLLFLRIQVELNLFFVTLTFNQDGAKNRQVVTPALFCTETSSLRRGLKSACSLPRCHFSLCTNGPG